MKVIYILIEQYQATDGEEYYHWIGEKPITYHESKEGVEERLSKEVTRKYDEHTKNYANNTHWNLSDWQKLGMEVMDNKTTFEVGTDGNVQEAAFFIIREQELLP